MHALPPSRIEKHIVRLRVATKKQQVFLTYGVNLELDDLRSFSAGFSANSLYYGGSYKALASDFVGTTSTTRRAEPEAESFGMSKVFGVAKTTEQIKDRTTPGAREM